MTTTLLAAPPQTARELLLGDPDALRIALAWPVVSDELRHRLGRVTRVAGRAVHDDVGMVIEALLDLDLVAVLVHGWRKHRPLIEAAHCTAASPAMSEVVDLAPHRVSLDHTPSVEVLADDVSVGNLDVSLSIVIDVSGVTAVVRGGVLVAVRGGPCTVTGHLAVEGFDVASRTASFDPRQALSLGDGLVLVGRAAAPAA